MKTLFSALLSLSLITSLWANSTTAEQLRTELIANSWHETNSSEWTGFGLMIEFHDNGVATIINNTHAEWPAMARYTWSVDQQRESPVVTFRNYLGSSFRYTIVSTERGLDLLPFESEIRPVIHLSYGKRLSQQQWNKNYQTLLGAWENTLAATTASSQVPQFRFNPDGTYFVSWGQNNALPKVQESGRWMLSKSSDFIILVPHDTDTLEYAKVRLISADEMVVEQLIVTKGSLVVNREVKNVFFNKL